MLFRHEIDAVVIKLGLFGKRAGLILALLLAGFVAWRYFQRWRWRCELSINRVGPEELLSMIEGEEPVTIVDLRSPAEVEKTGLKVRGARVLRPAELRKHFEQLPAGNEVILYCT